MNEQRLVSHPAFSLFVVSSCVEVLGGGHGLWANCGGAGEGGHYHATADPRPCVPCPQGANSFLSQGRVR